MKQLSEPRQRLQSPLNTTSDEGGKKQTKKQSKNNLLQARITPHAHAHVRKKQPNPQRAARKVIYSIKRNNKLLTTTANSKAPLAPHTMMLHWAASLPTYPPQAYVFLSASPETVIGQTNKFWKPTIDVVLQQLVAPIPPLQAAQQSSRRRRLQSPCHCQPHLWRM